MSNMIDWELGNSETSFGAEGDLSELEDAADPMLPGEPDPDPERVDIMDTDDDPKESKLVEEMYGEGTDFGLIDDSGKYVVESGDDPSKIAQKLVGDKTRWKELVKANPKKKRDKWGGFAKLYASERLNLPEDWVEKKAATVEEKTEKAATDAAAYITEDAGLTEKTATGKKMAADKAAFEKAVADKKAGKSGTTVKDSKKKTFPTVTGSTYGDDALFLGLPTLAGIGIGWKLAAGTGALVGGVVGGVFGMIVAPVILTLNAKEKST